jgi:hypothetical protein
MGYTHYYYQKKSFSTSEWTDIQNAVKQIVSYCNKNKIKLVYEYNLDSAPEVNGSVVRFNGYQDEGHETFVLEKKMPKPEPWQSNQNEYFCFCKTARKPYDLAVGLVLLAMTNLSDGVVSVSSDGDWDSEWQAIRSTYEEIFDTVPNCPFEMVDS